MISLLGSLGRMSLSLLAVLVVCLLPAASQAQSIKFNNTTKGNVVVEVIYYNGNQIRPQRGITLKPGDTTPAFTPPSGVGIQVKIYDAANPNLPPLNGNKGQGIPSPRAINL